MHRIVRLWILAMQKPQLFLQVLLVSNLMMHVKFKFSAKYIKISYWVKGHLHLIAIQLLILNCCVLWVNTLWFIICKSDISVAHLPSPWYVRHEKKLPTCWLVLTIKPLYGNIFFFFVFFFVMYMQYLTILQLQRNS